MFALKSIDDINNLQASQFLPSYTFQLYPTQRKICIFSFKQRIPYLRLYTYLIKHF